MAEDKDYDEEDRSEHFHPLEEDLVSFFFIAVAHCQYVLRRPRNETVSNGKARRINNTNAKCSQSGAQNGIPT